MKTALLTLGMVFLSLSAQAQMVSYTGVITARQACADSNESVFSKDHGCKALSVSNRTCNVKMNINQGEITKVSIEIPEAKAKGEVWSSVLSGSTKGAYLYERNFRAYSVKLSRSASAELKISNGNALLGLYVHTDHKEVSANKRTFVQYACGSLKIAKK